MKILIFSVFFSNYTLSKVFFSNHIVLTFPQFFQNSNKLNSRIGFVEFFLYDFPAFSSSKKVKIIFIDSTNFIHPHVQLPPKHNFKRSICLCCFGSLNEIPFYVSKNNEDKTQIKESEKIMRYFLSLWLGLSFLFDCCFKPVKYVLYFESVSETMFL